MDLRTPYKSLPSSPLNSTNLDLDWMNLAEDCEQLFPEINGLTNVDTVQPELHQHGISMPTAHIESTTSPTENNDSDDILNNIILDDHDLVSCATRTNNAGLLTADLISLQDLQDNDFNVDLLSQVVSESNLKIGDDSYELTTINLQDIQSELSTPEEVASPEPGSSSSSKLHGHGKRNAAKSDESEPKKRKGLDEETYMRVRKKNNVASHRSRRNRKDQEKQQEQKCLDLEKENELLKMKVKNLEELTAEVKKKLIDSIVSK